jgi:uncharacterized membrane protein
MSKGIQKRANELADQPKQIHLVQSSMYSGPIPPPEVLAKYNEIVQGAAERILKMAENQQNHRIELEKHVIKSQQRQSSIGQLFAIIIGIVGLFAGTYAVLQGHDIAGAALGGATLVSLVTAFLKGRSSQKDDIKKKKEKDS